MTRPRVARVVLVLVALLLAAGVALWLAARDAMGSRATGDRLARMARSAQWKEGTFHNTRPRVDGSMVRAVRQYFFAGSPYRVPKAPLPVVARAKGDYDTPPARGLRVTWLGHSTLLLEIDGRRVLIDPVWGERASPLSFIGPRRFHPPPLPLDALPPVDVVLISHDHYDHLDTPTVRALAARGTRFAVPLGVGAHLEGWGVPADQVMELDWWDAVVVADLTLTATPARHFSGRSLTDARRTLWAGWVVAGAEHRAYYSGDTALDDFMGEIGERLGPFDLTMIEVGAYNTLWADVHLGPEQAVRAHQLVRGEVLLPVHWGTFDLSLHGWTEPMERLLVAAAPEGVTVVTPRPGERVDVASPAPPTRWWPQTPWRTVEEEPAYSSGVQHLLQAPSPSPSARPAPATR